MRAPETDQVTSGQPGPWWPKTFMVGISLPGFRRGSATLWVAPGTIVCIPWRLTAYMYDAEPVTHQGTKVDIYIARLVPPWMNLTVRVRGTGGTLWASMALPLRRKLRRTIQAAGFEVTEHLTWFYGGGLLEELRRARPSGPSPSTLE